MGPGQQMPDTICSTILALTAFGKEPPLRRRRPAFSIRMFPPKSSSSAREYTGLSTALHLAERGVDAVVLEAVEIGFGGAGRNVGLVNAGMWVMPEELGPHP